MEGNAKVVALMRDMLFIVAIIVGANLSIASINPDICSESCRAAHEYRLWGIALGWYGIFLFISLVVTYLLYKLAKLGKFIPKIPLGSILLFLEIQLSAAMGAETWFLYIQKFVVGKWCMLCLGVFASLCLATFIVFSSPLDQERKNRMRKLALCLSTFIMAILFTVGGLDRPIASAAGIQKNPFLGPDTAKFEVVIVSDWFCPACRKAEPQIEEIAKYFKSKVRIAFVDYPFDGNAAWRAAYTPYNLTLLYDHKNNYLAGRQVLAKLSAYVKEPTSVQIQEALKKVGINLELGGYNEVIQGMAINKKIVQDLQITRTPTVAVRHIPSGKVELLIGVGDITVNSVRKAMQRLAQ